MYMETPSIAENGNTRDEQTMLYLKRIAIFKSKLYRNISVRDAFRLLFLDYKFCENDIFHIEMNPFMLFRSRNDL